MRTDQLTNAAHNAPAGAKNGKSVIEITEISGFSEMLPLPAAFPLQFLQRRQTNKPNNCSGEFEQPAGFYRNHKIKVTHSALTLI
jgi:hypothetical protein